MACRRSVGSSPIASTGSAHAVRARRSRGRRGIVLRRCRSRRSPCRRASRTARSRSRSSRSTCSRARSDGSTTHGEPSSRSTNDCIRRGSASVHPCARSLDASFRSEGAACVDVTTIVQPVTEPQAAFVAGVVAGEGTFFRSGEPPKFVFAVGLGASDAETCELLETFLGVGHITHSPRRKPHYDDEVTFAIQSLRDHLEVTIPFMDAHLPESHKRTQYLDWRGRWPCTVDRCDAPQRAHGFCRRHLWTFRRQ
jgi:hypothetical protein